LQPPLTQWETGLCGTFHLVQSLKPCSWNISTPPNRWKRKVQNILENSSSHKLSRK
jgi:hypothetical protein